jgi:hypothetical protein
LCALEGACDTEPDNPCLVLANIDLAADGALTIDDCAPRAVAPTNRILLDLIGCLARRVEECCGPSPTPTPTPTPTPVPTPTPMPTPTPTPTPPPLLQINGVRLYFLGERPPDSTAVGPLFDMQTPQQSVNVSGPVDTIEVLFELPEQPRLVTVRAQQTFIVQGQPIANATIVPMPAINAVRFHASTFPHGSYRVRLLDKIESLIGVQLDGEFPSLQPPATALKWPSGNGVPGGDFVFKLDIH